MSFDTRLKYLRIALNLFGFFFLVVLAPLMLGLWPSGWTWGVDQGYSHYALMIIEILQRIGGFFGSLSVRLGWASNTIYARCPARSPVSSFNGPLPEYRSRYR